MIGSLTYLDYENLIQNHNLICKKFFKSQIQPSSFDLTLSSECYQISSSFLSPNKTVRDKLEELIIKKIDLNKKFVLKKNKTYIIKLNEKLKLNNNIGGNCNPKSSTGRLDIFCRIVLDKSDEYEKIPINYKGEMFLEVTTRSFDLELIEGDSLNQMRLFYKKNQFINDSELQSLSKNEPLIFNNENLRINPSINNGIKISVDLSFENKINAYVAKKNTPILIYRKKKFHKIKDYWEKIKSTKNSLIIKKERFYILKSKEKIRIPPNLAGEMIPYDTSIGDFRAHYAGFFDPGFGNTHGSFAVLEVKTNEVPFMLEDCQTIARIKYEKLNKVSSVVYGGKINSNYQNQGLTLSKHFI